MKISLKDGKFLEYEGRGPQLCPYATGIQDVRCGTRCPHFRIETPRSVNGTKLFSPVLCLCHGTKIEIDNEIQDI